MITGSALRRVVTEAGGSSIEDGSLQEVLRQVLGDPTLTLAVWDAQSDHFRSVEGAPLTLPAEESGVRRLFVGDTLLGAVIHDPLLDDSSGLPEAIAAVSLVLGGRNGSVDLQRALVGIADAETEERVRIERDLHDGAVQRVLALRLDLARVRRESVRPELTAQLARLEEQAGAIGDDLRRLAHGIHPKTLVDLGLVEALQEAILERGGRVTLAGEPGRLPARIEQAVYFCVLEAIQNATRHAGSWVHVDVTLERSPQGFRFEIADNGVGFDPSAIVPGVGLTSIQARMRAIGGSVEVDSERGRGTRVRGHVPIPVEEWV